MSLQMFTQKTSIGKLTIIDNHDTRDTLCIRICMSIYIFHLFNCIHLGFSFSYSLPTTKRVKFVVLIIVPTIHGVKCVKIPVPLASILILSIQEIANKHALKVDVFTFK